MKTISLEEHPDNVAVFYAEDSDLTGAAKQVFDLIQDPWYSSVVVLRDQSHLRETFKAVSGDRRPIEKYSFVSDLSQYGYLPPDKWGYDFQRYIEFYRCLGPGDIELRSDDGFNRLIHLDEGYRFDQKELGEYPEDDIPPYGITVTMASHGGGTELIDVPAEEFKRSCVFIDEEIPVWSWKGNAESITDEQLWAVPNGAISVIRSQSWDEDHLPQLHRSSKRQDKKSSKERSVAVGFISGLKGM